MSEAELIAERANKAIEQVPKLTEAHACIDCQFIFRRGATCPYCGSVALWNLAEFFAGRNA